MGDFYRFGNHDVPFNLINLKFPFESSWISPDFLANYVANLPSFYFVLNVPILGHSPNPVPFQCAVFPIEWVLIVCRYCLQLLTLAHHWKPQFLKFLVFLPHSQNKRYSLLLWLLIESSCLIDEFVISISMQTPLWRILVLLNLQELSKQCSDLPPHLLLLLIGLIGLCWNLGLGWPALFLDLSVIPGRILFFISPHDQFNGVEVGHCCQTCPPPSTFVALGGSLITWEGIYSTGLCPLPLTLI